MAGFTAAYFISPKGEIIYCGVKHITTIIKNPEKFGFDKYFIEYVYNFYNEKIGQEGKAREQLILALLGEGWIRIRKYGDKFWSVNVDKLTRVVKQYLQKWAKAMLKGKNGIKEYDTTIPVKIDQPKKKVVSSDMSSIADSDSFVTEDKDIKLQWKTIEELEDLPLYECAKISKLRRYLK